MVIIHQIIIFAILMGIGYITAKTGTVGREGWNALSKLIVRVILPALIFSVVAGSEITTAEILDGGRFGIAVALYYFFVIIVANIMSKLCRLKGNTANIFIALAAFGNMGFMGIPLIQALFNEPVAQVCISVYTLIDVSLLWTYGVYLCSRHQARSDLKNALKNMFNPTTVALLAGFIIVLVKIPVPELLMQMITGIGGTSRYLSLMYIGGSLAFVSVGQIAKKPSIFLLIGVKMLVLPVLIYLMSMPFLPRIPATILTIIAGLPSMTIIAMLASAYDSDSAYATEAIFVTTLASLVTIPLVSIIVGMM